MSDLYFDGQDTAKVLSLLASPSEQDMVCPLCGSATWDIHPISDDDAVPPEWRWAL